MPETSKVGLLKRAVCSLIWSAPLLLPLVAVGGVVGGGAWGWILVVVALLVAHTLRMWRILICTFLCAFFVASAQAIRHTQELHLQRLLAEHESVSLEGVVVKEWGTGCILETGWLGVRVVLRGDAAWQVADVLRVTVQELPVLPPPVEGMFSPKRWMNEQGACENMVCLHSEKIGESWGLSRLVRLAAGMRRVLSAQLMPPGTEDDMRRQVLCALVLGEKEHAEADTLEIFRRGGCLHAFSVSGLHVGLVAAILQLLLRLLRVHPRVGRFLLLVLTGLYVLGTGAAVPAVRAYLMLAAFMCGLILRRRAVLFNTWCFVALLILVVQPWQFWQAGFRLSFVVYAAICLGVAYGMRDHPWFGPDSYIPARIRTRWERFLVVAELFVRGTVVVSLCAWLASLPLTVAMFHVVNTTSYLTNIAIAPLLPVVMGAGLAALALGWVPLLGAALHSVALKCAALLTGVVSLSASMPLSYLPAHEPAEASEALIIPIGGYGKSFCIMGNPGLVVGDITREADVRYTIEPALFHGGFNPAAAYCNPGAESRALFRRSFPAMRFPERAPGQSSATLSTPAGQYSIYYPSPEIPPTPAANMCPIVIWQRTDGMRIMYMGDAAMSTLESIPQDERQVDILILGYNPMEPMIDKTLFPSMDLQRIILLPSAAKLQLPDRAAAQPAERVGAQVLRL